MTLYDCIKMYNSGLDICDNIFDYTSHIDFTERADGTPRDEYSAAMIAIAKRLDVLTPRPDWYTECEITEFLNLYEASLKALMEEYLEHMPEPDPEEDAQEAFYDIYITTFDQLTKGSWPMEAYARLVELLENQPPVKEEVSKEEVTVEEITKKFGLTQTSLAAKIGVHSSLITKIKTGDSPVTEDVQEKFQKEFPDFVLVNDQYRLSRAIHNLQDLLKQLSNLEQEYQNKRLNITNQISLANSLIDDLSKKVVKH